jgi:hypothetical protein
LPEILVCRRHYPRVEPERFGCSPNARTPALAGPAEFGLELKQRVADLVQKKRAPVRLLKSPLTRAYTPTVFFRRSTIAKSLCGAESNCANPGPRKIFRHPRCGKINLVLRWRHSPDVGR